MIRISLILLYLALVGNVVGAEEYCPLLGPVFPAPRDLSKSTAFKRAKATISSALDEAIREAKASHDPIFDTNTTSISLQIFSGSRRHPLFYYSYTSQATRNAKKGVRNVDEDTVFRIGSCSKLWTVLLVLIEMGDKSFNEPVANYVPELKVAAARSKHHDGDRRDNINFAHWDEVTIGELAGQLAGITRDYGVMDLAQQNSTVTPPGFPQLLKSEIPPCIGMQVCDKSDFLEGLLKSHPVVPVASTPIYSNAAFVLLAYALEEITGKRFTELLEEDIIKPLHLTRSSYGKPDDKHGIIPDDPMSSWEFDMADETPAGGIYASTKDMSTLGSAILSSKLLPSVVTRRWMKPRAHTADMHSFVGAPWEIYSIPKPRVIDLYAKSGDIGMYSATTVLSPDHDVGFAVLVSGDNPTAAARKVPNLVVETLLPALEEAAKEDAQYRFSGTYALKTGNSSITITSDDGPGLKVTRWVNDSEDMFIAAAMLMNLGDPSQVSIRLQPTGLESPGKVSFRATMRSSALRAFGGAPFGLSCASWIMADSQKYGNIGIDEFLFDLNGNGTAVGVSPRTLRVSLPRRR